MTRRSGMVCSLGVAALLALLRSAAVPAWFADAQYYLQSGRLFQQGQVTFAGYLVGERHLAIGYYQVFQDIFGPSADSVAIALALTFGVAAGLVVTLCFIVGSGVWRPTVISVILIVLLSFIPIWNSALTDPLLLVLLLIVLNGIALIERQRSAAYGLVAAIGAVCGFGFGVRPETMVMAISVALTFLIPGPTALSVRARQIGIAGLAFVVGYVAQSSAWYLWVPAAKPPGYHAAFAFYIPMYYLGEPTDGPASAAIARMEETAGLPLTSEFIGLFPVMAAGAKAGTVTETDRLIARAGLELARAKPRRLASLIGTEARSYFVRPAFSLEYNGDPWDRRWSFMRQRLKALDDRREKASEGFGHDATWKTETLADQHVRVVEYLRAMLPSWSFIVRLPGALLLAGFATTLVALVFRRDRSAPIVGACLFVIGTFIITAFSQGFDARYSETWRYVSVLIIALTVLAWSRGVRDASPQAGVQHAA